MVPQPTGALLGAWSTFAVGKSRKSASSPDERQRNPGPRFTGSETDVCVLATVLGAVDRGYRVISLRDAICSSSDAGHDALLEVYERRFSLQIETADAETILAVWR